MKMYNNNTCVQCGYPFLAIFRTERCICVRTDSATVDAFDALLLFQSGDFQLNRHIFLRSRSMRELITARLLFSLSSLCKMR